MSDPANLEDTLSPTILTIDRSGKTVLWVTTILFALSSLLFVLLASRVHPRKRTFHYLNALITIISVLNYYKMASGEGYHLIPQPYRTVNGQRQGVIRQVFDEHYLNWSMCTPTTMFQTALVSGMSWKDIVIFVLANEGLIQTGWVAALETNQTRKFVWWGFSIAFLIYILYSMIWIGGKAARQQPHRVHTLYEVVVMIGGTALMVTYTANFLISEGLNIVSVGTEQTIYCVLDVLARIPLGLILIFIDELTDHEFRLGELPESWVEMRSSAKNCRVFLDGPENP
ncbi:family A G protein-coupled receptor-like protein [Sistotremastrum niveocremeum HHB9708]|uniref:Family A G protein-coupled receptor-like protein n=1 Tax=Sistotremastrum niveocremeum HHB9708 TaxID=1314777 RepID=A0A164TIV4_9AGAM|nr:family A G protein-coupled receptor-like protein [Sistotremastrum niveocremeum HHB9708]